MQYEYEIQLTSDAQNNKKMNDDNDLFEVIIPSIISSIESTNTLSLFLSDKKNQGVFQSIDNVFHGIFLPMT